MIKNLCIHIGDHKSGTTSIQTALVDPSLKVDGKSICYPTRRSHNGIAKKITAKNETIFLRKRLTAIAEDFKNSDAEWGFLSAEEFEGFHAKALKNFISEWFPEHLETVKIVAYVRPHAQRLLSNFAEDVKIGCFDNDLNAYFDHEVRTKRFIYTPRFESWRQVFGDRFILRPMLRDQLADGDVVLDFLSQVCGTDNITLPEPKDTNSSLGLEDLAALREMHIACAERLPNWRHALGWHWQTLMTDMPGGVKTTRVALDEQLAEKVLKTYGKDAAALDAAFFGGTQMLDCLEKDVQKTVPLPQSIRAEDHFGEAELYRLQIVARLVADMSALLPKKQIDHIRNMTTEILLK